MKVERPWASCPVTTRRIVRTICMCLLMN